MYNNTVRCPKRHFYDKTKFESCPYCQELNSQTLAQTQSVPKNMDYSNYKTISVNSLHSGSNRLLVGWLVCIKGSSKGRSYIIRSNKNFIGRDPSMDITITGDQSISRIKHAVITYIPQDRIFIAQPGESRELFYVNSQVVLNNVMLKAYDQIEIGKSCFLFIPFCDDDFSWETFKEIESCSEN